MTTVCTHVHMPSAFPFASSILHNLPSPLLVARDHEEKEGPQAPSSARSRSRSQRSPKRRSKSKSRERRKRSERRSKSKSKSRERRKRSRSPRLQFFWKTRQASKKTLFRGPRYGPMVLVTRKWKRGRKHGGPSRTS